VGYVLHARGAFDEALRSYREARDRYERLHQSDPFTVRMVRLEIAGLIEDAGERLKTEVTDAEREWKPSELGNDGVVAIILRNRGRILCRFGRVEEGDALLIQSSEWTSSMPPETATRYRTHTRRVRAELLAAAGVLEQAEEELRDVLGVQETLFTGRDAAALVPTLLGLADTLHRAGRAEEALSLVERARNLRAEAMGAEAWPVAIADLTAAECLVALGRSAEARRAIVRAGGPIRAAFDAADSRCTRLESVKAEVDG
jgi:tetratricopeptide (TPR) repeat protein